MTNEVLTNDIIGTSIYIWIENFSRSACVKIEVKMAEFDGQVNVNESQTVCILFFSNKSRFFRTSYHWSTYHDIHIKP